MPGTYLHQVNPTYFPARKKKERNQSLLMLLSL